MAAKVGAMAVSLTAKTAAFNKKMRDSAKRVDKFAAVARKATRGIGLLGAASVAVAGFGLLRLTKASLASIDALAKTSDKIGIATEELAKLQFAAKITGVETETLNKALQNMTRGISEAAQGTGEAKDALKELGVDAKRLNRLTVDEKFLKIATAMKTVKNQADKVRIAFDLFGGRGTGLLNTLALGATGLHDLGIEAENLGLAISRFDAAKVEQANDAFEKLKSSITGVGNKLAIGLSPSIEAIAGIMTEQVKGANDWASAIVDGAESGAVAVAALKDIIDKVGRSFLGIRFSFAKIGTFKFLDIARNNSLPPDKQLTPQEMENFRNENQDRADALLRRMIDDAPTSSVDSVKKTFADMRKRAKATAAKQAGTGSSGLAIKGFVLPSVLRAVQAASDRAALLAPGRISGLGPGFGRQPIIPRDFARERADFERGVFAQPRTVRAFGSFRGLGNRTARQRERLAPFMNDQIPRPAFMNDQIPTKQSGVSRPDPEQTKQTNLLREIRNGLKTGTTSVYAR